MSRNKIIHLVELGKNKVEPFFLVTYDNINNDLDTLNLNYEFTEYQNYWKEINEYVSPMIIFFREQAESHTIFVPEIEQYNSRDHWQNNPLVHTNKELLPVHSIYTSNYKPKIKPYYSNTQYRYDQSTAGKTIKRLKQYWSMMKTNVGKKFDEIKFKVVDVGTNCLLIYFKNYKEKRQIIELGRAIKGFIKLNQDFSQAVNVLRKKNERRDRLLEDLRDSSFPLSDIPTPYGEPRRPRDRRV